MYWNLLKSIEIFDVETMKATNIPINLCGIEIVWNPNDDFILLSYMVHDYRDQPPYTYKFKVLCVQTFKTLYDSEGSNPLWSDCGKFVVYFSHKQHKVIKISISMSRTKLDNFIEDNIKIKFIDNGSMSYFKETGYCDYRCGCDLCGSGDARGFKTNILDLVDNSLDGWFFINDLDVKIKDSWCESEDYIYLRTLYETNDKNVINKIGNIFDKFSGIFDNQSVPRKYELLSDRHSDSSLTGCFDNNQNRDEIKNVRLCSNCYKWVVMDNNEYCDKFSLINTFKIFWADVMNDYLSDLIEYEDKNMKKIVENLDP